MTLRPPAPTGHARPRRPVTSSPGRRGSHARCRRAWPRRRETRLHQGRTYRRWRHPARKENRKKTGSFHLLVSAGHDVTAMILWAMIAP